MAARKPLVLKDGIIHQLPAGDTIDAPITATTEYSIVNNSGGAMGRLQSVYSEGTNNASLARANAENTSRWLGFVKDITVNHTNSFTVITNGVVVAASSAEWEAVVENSGTPEPLTASVRYYLSPDVAGKITPNPTTTSGNILLQVGIALSTTVFLIQVRDPIKI